jgi:VanZ family protein
MAVLPHPPRLPGAPSDKVQHIIAFLTLGVFAVAAYPRAPLVRAVTWLSAFGAMIEVVQAIPDLHRDSDPLDWLVDTIAALAAVAAARLGFDRWTDGSAAPISPPIHSREDHDPV